MNAWKYCCRVFDLLTIAAIIDESILCVHGGLSPDIKTLDQIRTIDRLTILISSRTYSFIGVNILETKKFLTKERSVT